MASPAAEHSSLGSCAKIGKTRPPRPLAAKRALAEAHFLRDRSLGSLAILGRDLPRLVHRQHLNRLGVGVLLVSMDVG